MSVPCSRVDAAGVSISNEGKNWLALLRQVQLSWDLALQEFGERQPPNEAFLPGDAQRVIVSVRHHCDEIASTTEKARMTWRTWVAKNRGVTEKTGRLMEKARQP